MLRIFRGGSLLFDRKLRGVLFFSEKNRGGVRLERKMRGEKNHDKFSNREKGVNPGRQLPHAVYSLTILAGRLAILAWQPSDWPFWWDFIGHSGVKNPFSWAIMITFCKIIAYLKQLFQNFHFHQVTNMIKMKCIINLTHLEEHTAVLSENSLTMP